MDEFRVETRHPPIWGGDSYDQEVKKSQFKGEVKLWVFE